jgi:hypothetical protein
VTLAAMSTVCAGVHPIITPPILMAASVTEAMMMMLNRMPR